MSDAEAQLDSLTNIHATTHTCDKKYPRLHLQSLCTRDDGVVFCIRCMRRLDPQPVLHHRADGQRHAFAFKLFTCTCICSVWVMTSWSADMMRVVGKANPYDVVHLASISLRTEFKIKTKSGKHTSTIRKRRSTKAHNYQRLRTSCTMKDCWWYITHMLPNAYIYKCVLCREIIRNEILHDVLAQNTREAMPPSALWQSSARRYEKKRQGRTSYHHSCR